MKGGPFKRRNAGDDSKNRCESFRFLSSEELMAGFCICLPGCMLMHSPCLTLKNVVFSHCVE